MSADSHGRSVPRSADMLRAAYDRMVVPGTVAELRILVSKGVTLSGYYDDRDALVRDAERRRVNAKGVYITLNPVVPALLARSPNRLTDRPERTTSDIEIRCRSRLLLDFDPVRPAEISSTDAEHDAALRRAEEVREHLSVRGWPAPLYADSGNGAHLTYGIELPNDAEATALSKRVLAALEACFGDATVAVDQTTFNAARLVKLYGTPATKGASTPERPHRLSRIIDAPNLLEVVPRSLLEDFAAMAPPESRPAPVRGPGRGAGDVVSWVETELAARGLVISKRRRWQNTGTLFELKSCPWDASHEQSARVIVFDTGALSAGCFHNSCTGHGWRDLREVLGIEWPRYETNGASKPEQRERARPTTPWPTLHDDARYGLAGEFVALTEEHTEADPVALLLQFLVALGNMIGRGPYYLAEADRHYTNLFACLVGVTSKGRKGSSWGHVRARCRSVDENWAATRILGGLSSGEGLIWQVRDPIEREGKGGEEPEVVVEGVDDKRLLAYESEFASALRVLGRDGNTLSTTIRQSWDTGELRTLVKNSPAQATGAHISIIGHVTQDELVRRLDETEMANGFANRFLWACVTRARVLPFGGHLDGVNFAPFTQRLKAAVDFAARLGDTALRFDDDASELWADEYERLSAGRPGLLGAVTSRAEAQVVRLALTYALLDCSREIKLPHLEAALAVWHYCADSAAYIFGDTLGDPVADEILSALRARPDGMTRNQIRDLFSRNRDAEEIARALTTLEKYGLASRESRPTGGRPAEVWTALRVRGKREKRGKPESASGASPIREGIPGTYLQEPRSATADGGDTPDIRGNRGKPDADAEPARFRAFRADTQRPAGNEPGPANEGENPDCSPGTRLSDGPFRVHNAFRVSVTASDASLLGAGESERQCPACRGTDFWLSRARLRRCRRCYPPAPGAEAQE